MAFHELAGKPALRSRKWDVGSKATCENEVDI